VCDLKYVYIHTYEEEYDFTGVGDRLMEEAKEWFGCRMKPPVRYRAEYHLWRKWNDVSYNDFCFVRSKVAPIEDKGTRELAFSPTYKMNVSENRYKKVLAIGKFAFLKEQYKMDKEENKEADLFEVVRLIATVMTELGEKSEGEEGEDDEKSDDEKSEGEEEDEGEEGDDDEGEEEDEAGIDDEDEEEDEAGVDDEEKMRRDVEALRLAVKERGWNVD